MSGRKYVGDIGKPLSPSEILASKQEVPGYVYDAFNECIRDAADGQSVHFTRNHLLAAILRRAPREYDPWCKHLVVAAMDYEAHGWVVTFDMQEGSSEPYSFTFTPRSDRSGGTK